MEEVEIMIDGKKVKTISKLSKEEIDDNSMRLFLDDTVDLDDLVKEIKKDDISGSTGAGEDVRRILL